MQRRGEQDSTKNTHMKQSGEIHRVLCHRDMLGRDETDRGNFGREEIDRGELGTDNVRKDQSPDLTESHQALPLPHETWLNVTEVDKDEFEQI